MKTSSEVVIDQAATNADLADWLQNLSDQDYQACSGSHRAAGVFRENGTFGSINVEAIGGHLLVQHYLAVRADRNHVVMHSTKTRVYLLHLLPVTIEVIWTLQVEPCGTNDAVFRCAVETRMNPILTFVATLAALPYFLQRHVAEETPLFASDLSRKIAGYSLPPTDASTTLLGATHRSDSWQYP